MRSTVVSLKKENNNIIECDLDHAQDASDAPLSCSKRTNDFRETTTGGMPSLLQGSRTGLGERFALFGERVAILEAQRREDKAHRLWGISTVVQSDGPRQRKRQGACALMLMKDLTELSRRGTRSTALMLPCR